MTMNRYEIIEHINKHHSNEMDDEIMDDGFWSENHPPYLATRFRMDQTQSGPSIDVNSKGNGFVCPFCNQE